MHVCVVVIIERNLKNLVNSFKNSIYASIRTFMKMRTPKVKNVGTPRKSGTPSPSTKDNITENTPGVMTRSQAKLLGPPKFRNSLAEIASKIPNTPVRSSRKSLSNMPISSAKRSLMSRVSLSKRRKRDVVQDSDNAELTDTIIEEHSDDSSESLHIRSRKVARKLEEDDMSDKDDKVKKKLSPETGTSVESYPDNLNEITPFTNTNKECRTRLRSSLAKKLENDMTSQDNEPKGIKSLRNRKSVCKIVESVNENMSKEEKTRPTRSSSRKLENTVDDEINKDTEIKSPQIRGVVSDSTESLNVNKLSPTIELHKVDVRNVSRKLKNDMNVQGRKSTSKRKDENKSSQNTNRESMIELRSAFRKLEINLSLNDSEPVKTLSPKHRKNIIETSDIVNDSESSTRTHKEMIKSRNTDETEEPNDAKLRKSKANESSPKKSENEKNSKRNVSNKCDDKSVLSSVDSEYSGTHKDIKLSPKSERRKSVRLENVTTDAGRSRAGGLKIKSPKGKNKSETSVTKKLIDAKYEEDNERNLLKFEVNEDKDEPLKILFSNVSSAAKKIDDTKSEGSMFNEMEYDKSNEGITDKQIQSSEISEYVDESSENQLDSEYPAKKRKDKVKSKSSLSRKMKDDESDDSIKAKQIKSDSEHMNRSSENQINSESPAKKRSSRKIKDDESDDSIKAKQIKSDSEHMNRSSEIRIDSESPSRKKSSRKMIDGESDDDTKAKQIKSGSEHMNKCSEYQFDSESSAKKRKDTVKSKRSLSRKIEGVESDDHTEAKQIKSPNISLENLLDSESSTKKIKEKFKFKSSPGRIEDCDNDSIARQINSPDISEHMDEYSDDLLSSTKERKDKVKSKRSLSRRVEDDSDVGIEFKQISSDNSEFEVEYSEMRPSSKSSAKKKQDKCRRSLSKKMGHSDSDEYSEIVLDSESSLKKIKDKTKSRNSSSKKMKAYNSEESIEAKQVRSGRENNQEIMLHNHTFHENNSKLKGSISSSSKNNLQTSLIEIYDISSENESENLNILNEKRNQQDEDIEGHITVNSTESDIIIIENSHQNTGGNCSNVSQRSIQKDVLFRHGEMSESDNKVIASNSRATEEMVSTKTKRLLGEKLNSPGKCKLEAEFRNKDSSPKNNISSTETIRFMKTSKQPSVSPPFRSKPKEDFKSESSDSDSDAESRKAIKESAQKRIIQNLSTSESDSKKFMRPVTTLCSEHSDSESSPEEIPFIPEMDSLKNAVESINKDKQKRKERRKQRLEKYKQQKEEKLIRLKEKRASQEDASCSSSEESGYEEDTIPATVGKSKKKQRARFEKENVDDPSKGKLKKFNVSNDEADTKERKEKKRKHEQIEVPQNVGNLRKLPSDILEILPDQMPLKVPKFDKETSAAQERKIKKPDIVKGKKPDFRSYNDIDYIPLNSRGSTEFGVVPLETFSKSSKSMAQQAADFRQRMLYGSHIKRETGNAHLIYQQKLKVSGKDRFVR